MISALLGIIAAALGLWGIVLWPNELIAMAKGLLPISLFFAGFVAIIAGLAGGLSSRSPKLKDHGKN